MTFPTVAFCAAALALSTASLALAATARDPRFGRNLEATVSYLQSSQREDGGFAEAGREPVSETSAWVAIALAAAGINPRDQTTAEQHHEGGHSAYSFLAEHVHDASSTTDFERELLVVDAAGTSPEEFGGVNLVNRILSRQITSGADAGAFGHEVGGESGGVNDTVYAILALSPIHEPQVQEAIARAARWLQEVQDCDGSWPPVQPRAIEPCPSERRLLPGEADSGETDMTGAALQALSAAGYSDPLGQARAFAYLREAEAENGGLVELLDADERPNVASTAWGVQAMWAARINPETWSTGSRAQRSDEPLGYLASMQTPDGHVRYSETEDVNGMWMTAYVAPALAGDPLPIPATPYEPLPAEPPREGPGGGGVSPSPGEGVDDSRGGQPATLFSRPQPGSQGHTPGGARELERQKREGAGARLWRNPGPARTTRAPTTSASDPGRLLAQGDTARAPVAAGGSAAGNSGLGGRAKRAEGAGAEVRGVLIGSPSAALDANALEAGAPGLRAAAAGGDREQWLTIATLAAIAMLVIAGALLEHRRPQVSS